MGIIPDRIILLNQSDKKSIHNITEKLIVSDPNISEERAGEIACKMMEEYNLHLPKIKAVFKDSIFTLETCDKHQQ